MALVNTFIYTVTFTIVEAEASPITSNALYPPTLSISPCPTSPMLFAPPMQSIPPTVHPTTLSISPLCLSPHIVHPPRCTPPRCSSSPLSIPLLTHSPNDHWSVYRLYHSALCRMFCDCTGCDCVEWFPSPRLVNWWLMASAACIKTSFPFIANHHPIICLPVPHVRENRISFYFAIKNGPK